MLRHAEEKREKWNQRINTLAALLRSNGTSLLEHTKTSATKLPMQFTSATFPTTAASATFDTSPPPHSEWFDSGLTSEVESSDGTSAESVEDNPMKDSSDESDDNVPEKHGEESVFGVAASIKRAPADFCLTLQRVLMATPWKTLATTISWRRKVNWQQTRICQQHMVIRMFFDVSLSL
ncbi:hypothetical protein PsorP6_012131 [Peronosclerospora sorghi]|uniref:Uncharacterized protein n=1 Tax=Peronosclerospora sorghi TaxID=230839 RepID=A0ACC0WKX0_9STRA|nr:hypothetical protein PsorP6_012131 [Peronosclerospora sorghi]